jgi:hypothetical protein
MMPQYPRHLSAIAIAVGSLVTTSAVLVLHAHGDTWLASALIPVPFALFGSALFIGVRRQLAYRAARALVLEQQMLALVRANGGRVTPAEVALHCHVRVVEARAMLEALCANGAAESVMGAQSSVAYVVPGMVRSIAPMASARARAITPTRSLASFSASLPPTPSRRGERPFGACAVRARPSTNPGREPAPADKTKIGGFDVATVNARGGSVSPRST